MKKFFAMILILGVFFITGNNMVSAEGKILVAYFSRTGSEYGTGNITKGNTEIIAEIIANKVGADIFKIKPAQNYPENYDECKKIASQEKATKARPKFIGSVENFEQYDTIFIGYPIWYGDMPMIVYTFLESYDFADKKIIPFCTHAGSGLSSTDQQITLTCPQSKILQGFEIRGAVAQNNSAESNKKVSEWLGKLGY